MSATRRGRASIPHDNYQTPYWCTLQLIEELKLETHVPILDPFAGEGAILKTFEFMGHSRLYAWEIRKEAETELVGVCGRANVAIVDTLKQKPKGRCPSAIVTNVPYGKEQEAVEFLVHRFFEEGKAPVVATLGKLQYLASKERNSWIRNHMPHRILVLSRRPSFGKPCTPEDCPVIMPTTYRGSCPVCQGALSSGGDAATYGWFIWQQGEPYPKESRLKVLPYFEYES